MYEFYAGDVDVVPDLGGSVLGVYAVSGCAFEVDGGAFSEVLDECAFSFFEAGEPGCFFYGLSVIVFVAFGVGNGEADVFGSVEVFVDGILSEVSDDGCFVHGFRF